MHQLGYINCFNVWAPLVKHTHTQKGLERICALESLLKRIENIPFLNQIVTSDVKWILYNNVEWKRSWGKQNEPPPTTTKANLHPKKVMWCI